MHGCWEEGLSETRMFSIPGKVHWPENGLRMLRMASKMSETGRPWTLNHSLIRQTKQMELKEPGCGWEGF